MGSRYQTHAKCNNSKTEALSAYSWNIELSQALFPALKILEIALRNSLHSVNLTKGLSIFAAKYLDTFDQFQDIYAKGKSKVSIKLND